MARDPIETRAFAPVVPADVLDPARFGQLAETVQDAFIESLRAFFSRQAARFTAQTREMPTIRKYAQAASGAASFPMVEQLIEEFADLPEKLPHIAVLGVSGPNDPHTLGRVTYGATQLAPRIVSAAGPFALGAPTAEVWVVTLTALPSGGVWRVRVDGQPVEVTIASGTTNAAAVVAFVSAVRNSPVGEVVTVASNGLAVTLTYRETGVAFTVLAEANAAAARTVAAVAGDTSVLEYRTTPNGVDAVDSRVTFAAMLYPPSESPATTSAARAAAIVNGQALHARARVLSGERIEIRSWPNTPNEIEVRTESTDSALAAFGFGVRRTLVSAGQPGTNGRQRIVVSSATFAADDASGRRFVVLPAPNEGRKRIVAFVSATTVDVENAEGVESTGGAVFFGARDDWTNPARPVQNTYAVSWKPTVSLVVLAEDATERNELTDLVVSWASFFLEHQYFTLLGRGVLDDDFPDEQYQIVLEPAGIGRGPPGSSDRPGGDLKGKIHEAQVSVPCSAEWTLPRPVTVNASASGPPAGSSWVIRTLTERDDIPDAS